MNAAHINSTAAMRAKSRFVVFDLDGCVADDEWRLHKILSEGSADRYKEYHSYIPEDCALIFGAETLVAHMTAGDYVVFITARPEYTRMNTQTWLAKQFPNIDYSLYMRPNNDDHTHSAELKKGIVTTLMNALYKHQSIVAAYDDRYDVVKMYRSLGINALVVDKNGQSLPFDCAAEVVDKPVVEACDKPVGVATLPSEKEVDYSALKQSKGNVESVSKQFTGKAGAFFIDVAIVGDLMHCQIKDNQINDNQPDDVEIEFPPIDNKKQISAADILENAGSTFRERNAVYKDNADNVGKVMAALFPDGVQLKLATDHKMYHLFELLVVKLTRFANSGLTHTDSIHDLMVYAAMCENLVQQHNIKFENLEKQ